MAYNEPQSDPVIAPLIYLGLGISLARACERVFPAMKMRVAVILLITVASVAVAIHHDKYPQAWRLTNQNDDDNRLNLHNLYDQWFWQNDTTEQCGKFSAEISRTGRIVIYAGDDALTFMFYFALYRPQSSEGGGAWFEKLRENSAAMAKYRQLSRSLPIVIVAMDYGAAERVAREFNLPIQKLRVISQMGRFDFYTTERTRLTNTL